MGATEIQLGFFFLNVCHAWVYILSRHQNQQLLSSFWEHCEGSTHSSCTLAPPRTSFYGTSWLVTVAQIFSPVMNLSLDFYE